MSELFRNTLAPWQWALLALVPAAIVALYFLKLRRQPLSVPSTYLWKRSIEDLHVNSLWQRLRQNLLMFLQLLLVGLAILALLRPGWQGRRLEGERFIFLIDNSASMSATDPGAAASRLDEAKRLADELIGQLDSGMSAMIISFADKPHVVAEFTTNRRLLRERLASIEPTAQGTDLAAALELANGLANAGGATPAAGRAAATPEPTATTAYIFSDGRFDDATGVTLDHLQPRYVSIGSFDAPNLAITAVSTRRNEDRPEQQQAFVQVANFTHAPENVVVELELDGRFLDAAEIEVPAGETKGTVFPLADGAVGGLTARLRYKLDGSPRDSLRVDDVGYAALNQSKTGRVLVVSPGDVPLELALGTARAQRLAKVDHLPPSALASADYRRAAGDGTYDLVVYDQCAPEEMPRANTLFVGRLPPGKAWLPIDDATHPVESGPPQPVIVAGPQVIDWDRASPLLAHVDLGDLVIADSDLVRPPAGGTVLIESTAGPIAAIAPRDRFQDVVLGFELIGQNQDGTRTANTNWPIRPSFPTFWLNALEYLASHGEEPLAVSVRPGRTIELQAPPEANVLTVVAPDGRTTDVLRTDQGRFAFADTATPGVYQVRRGDAVVERFAVNLFDRAESDVGVRPSQESASQTLRPADIRIGRDEVAAATDQIASRREIWKVLLAGALFVLLLEWYIYNRRVYL